MSPLSPTIAGAFRRRPTFNIIAFTLAVFLAVGSLVTADLWWRRDRTLAAAETRASSLAELLAEYVRGSFTSADAALRQLAIHGQRVGGSHAPRDAWDPMLAAAKAALPESGSFSVTDRTGTITHSTLPRIVGQSRRDTYIYRRLSTGGIDELILDKPYLARRPPTAFVMPLGRPLLQADGSFDGMLVATVLPEAYRAFFASVGVGAGGVISVLHPDGVVLFREPSRENPINDAAVNDPLLKAALQPGGGTGTVRGPLAPGGPRFVSAYRTVGHPPVVVTVSLSEQSVLEDWRRQRRVTLTAFGALTLTLGLMVLMLFRVVDARERAERRLAALQRQESERLREANEQLAAALEREQRARKETEAASYMKDEFLMTVSHELRTPLTAIYGWARVLGTRQLEPGKQARAIAAIERNAHSQTRLIDDLLDVSRAISGKLRLELQPVNVAEVLRAAVETVTPAMVARRLTFITEFDPDTPSIVADPERLQQIAWNLLSNAIKFTPEGGTVRLALSRSGTQVEIAVSDDGTGILPEFLPYVFERFRQADAGSRRRYGGLGLGLAIVRHLVELHGGTVTATSAGEDQGATFRVRLPLSPAARPGPASVSAAGARPGPGGDRLDGVTVLVVDDDADARELFTSILQGAGATVLTAASAGEALRVLADEPIAVLLSDLEMPGQDGYVLLREAMAARKGAPLVAVAVTAYARSADRRRALDAGFLWHLSKPVEPAELVSVVGFLLRHGDNFPLHNAQLPK